MSEAAFDRNQAPPPAAPVVGAVAVPAERLLGAPESRDLSARQNSAFLRRIRRGWRRRPTSDRVHAAGDAFFEQYLLPHLDRALAESLRAEASAGRRVVLETDLVEPLARPLARRVGAKRFTARRLEFHDELATGRLLPGVVEVASEAGPIPAARATFLDRAVCARNDGLVSGDPPLSVRGAFAGKNLLVLGVSGFVGKVWLASLLQDVPDVGRIHVLVRRRGSRRAADRFAQLVKDSPVLQPFARRLADVHVLEGDVSEPGLGLDAETTAKLSSSLDLVVNCAGLTEFNPDPRDALAVNVNGAERVLELVRGSDRAALLHVSTCFVAGAREGRITEELRPNETPSGQAPFDPLAEIELWRAAVDRECAHHRNGNGSLRSRLVRHGIARARELGWPNIYTFSKALGEGMLATRGRDLPISVVRPSIVESSVEFPFRGWNEGINTSAPLSHLLGTYFRQLPVNERKHLDVIPVDLVARGLTLVGAALLERRHPEVVQLATSAVNPLDLRRAVELTALAHRTHYRNEGGWRSRLLARLEAVPVSRERYLRLSVPAQLRFVRGVNRFLRTAFAGRTPFGRLEHALARAKELIDLYEPFLLDNEPVFEADHVEILAAALPSAERERFGWKIRELDWYDYWVRVHIPALRRWSYPLLERRPIEAAAPYAAPGSAGDGPPTGTGRVGSSRPTETHAPPGKSVAPVGSPASAEPAES